jgi:hypothetical protein
MNRFDNLEPEELETIDRIIECAAIDRFPDKMIAGLVGKYVLEDFQGSLIVPAFVWDQWRRFKAETSWTRPSHLDRLKAASAAAENGELGTEVSDLSDEEFIQLLSK